MGCACQCFYVFLLSLAPGFEGRYAILAGVAMGIPLWASALVAAAASAALAAALGLAIERIDGVLSKSKLGPLRSLYAKALSRARAIAAKRSSWSALALAAFVAIPLPATGVWTGSLVAYVMGLPKRETVAALAAGGIASVAIVAAVAALGSEALRYFT